MIEKKIRAVQKKLRRVQTIESEKSSTTIDSAQQVLLASKPRLQALLAGLLQQWAVLEPALLEQQAQKMLAIANAECAICACRALPAPPAPPAPPRPSAALLTQLGLPPVSSRAHRLGGVFSRLPRHPHQLLRLSFSQ